MSIFNKIFGRPLPSSAAKKNKLSVITGVPALGLGCLASISYGPEAAMMILLPLGLVGLHYFFFLTLGVILVLLGLYCSYQQTTAAYPTGGGAYVVASENLGPRVGLCAAVALLLDYLLNVAVGISAGIGAVVSAIPVLHPYILVICLTVLLMLTLLNLRGVQEPGLAFAIPTFIFVLFMGITIVIALIQTWKSAGHPVSIVPPTMIPKATTSLSLWILLGAFANGLTAMTGIEAVSNAVPLFRHPSVKNAQRTLTVIVGILGLFLLGIAILCPAYQISAMDETKPGYETILSQLIAAATGKGTFYFLTIASIFIILTYSAQTSFIGFPRVCRLLAEDNYLPHFFAEKGRRLVFSYGIIVLAVISAFILIIFKGITLSLIPLFAVGAFSAFLFSQIGMVMHWLHKKDPNARLKLFFNGLGAVVTFFALCIIIIAKFIEGAWIVIVLAILFVMLFTKINHHYKKVSKLISEPLKLQTAKLKPPVVIIPIQGWDRVSEKAILFGLLLSDDVTAIYVSTNEEDEKELKEIWVEKVENPAKKKDYKIPKLEVINSPYRRISKPILNYVKKMKCEKPDRLIAVIIPELIEAHWYEYLLHNVHAARLRALLFLKRDQRTIVITTPWYLRE